MCVCAGHVRLRVHVYLCSFQRAFCDSVCAKVIKREKEREPGLFSVHSGMSVKERRVKLKHKEWDSG